jgi:hypothetical protein
MVDWGEGPDGREPPRPHGAPPRARRAHRPSATGPGWRSFAPGTCGFCERVSGSGPGDLRGRIRRQSFTNLTCVSGPKQTTVSGLTARMHVRAARTAETEHAANGFRRGLGVAHNAEKRENAIRNFSSRRT